MKASLLASGQLRTGRGQDGSVSLAVGSGDEGADGSALEAAESFAEALPIRRRSGRFPRSSGYRQGFGALGTPPGPCSPRHRPRPPQGPQPSGKQNLSAFIWSVAAYCGATTSRATTTAR